MTHDTDQVIARLRAENASLRQRVQALENAALGRQQTGQVPAEHPTILGTFDHRYVQHHPDIIVLLDADGVIHYYSPSLYRVMGFHPHEVVGRHIFGALHADDVPRVKAMLATLLQQQETARVIEYRARHRDGSWRTFEAVAIALDDARDGSRIIVSARDITERHRIEELFRLTHFAIEHSSEAAFWITPEARFIYVNEAACRALGYKRDELLTLTVCDIDTNVTPAAWPETWHSLKTRRCVQGESQYRTRDGRLLPVEITANYLEFGGEAFNCTLARDVTERRKAEMALRDSEFRYRALVEQSLVGIYFFYESRYLYVNPRFAEIFGYTPEEIAGQLRPGWDLAVEAERPQVQARLQALLRGEADSLHYPIRCRRKDGTLLDVEVHSARLEYQGQPAIIGVLLDITERRRAEIALGQSEDRFRNLVTGSIQGLMIHRNFKPLFVNQAYASIFGYDSPDDILAMHHVIKELTAPHEHARLIGYAQARMRGEEAPAYHEYQGVRRDGSVVWVENRVSVIEWEGGPAIQLTTLDITERKRAEEERNRLEQQLSQGRKMEAIGTLAGGIAHDFNNILAAIIGYSELALYDLPEGTKPHRNLQEVLRASQRARDLVQQILTFSRQTRQAQHAIPLHRLVEETLTLLRATLPTTIDIRHNLRPDSGAVMADVTQMQQVIMNLCTNAEHAMRGSHGILDIGLEAVDLEAAFTSQHLALEPGPYVRLMVRDTGHGMDAATLGRIFEPFYTTKAAGEGTGMGLAVVHGIVTNHRGAITVQSTLGVGTTFTVYLPRIAEVSKMPIYVEPSLPAGTEHILFVDDDPSLAQWGHELLARLGYKVDMCTSSSQALTVFQATPERFDLLITDQTMPHMSGERLIQAMRRIRADLPAILCTGFSYVIDAEKARAMGIEAFLLKPLVMRDLAMTIRQVLERPDHV